MTALDHFEVRVGRIGQLAQHAIQAQRALSVSVHSRSACNSGLAPSSLSAQAGLSTRRPTRKAQGTLSAQMRA